MNGGMIIDEMNQRIRDPRKKKFDFWIVSFSTQMRVMESGSILSSIR